MIRTQINSVLFAVALTLSLVTSAFVQTSVRAADEPTVLITGASRGIGLELARAYAEQGWNVIATCRTPSSAEELQAIAAEYSTVSIEEMDVTDQEEIAAVSAKYEGKPIDVLINNAGVPGDAKKQVVGSFDKENFDLVMNVNVLGPLLVSEAFMSSVEMSGQKKIINITSGQGTITLTNSSRGIAYFSKASKSALNMVTRVMALEKKKSGVIVGAVSPGWVRTYYGGRTVLRGNITPEESANFITKVIDDFDLTMSGNVYSHKGEQMGW